MFSTKRNNSRPFPAMKNQHQGQKSESDIALTK